LSDVDQCISYIFIWHSCADVKSCPTCVALNGREYRNQDLFAPVLVDPQFGPVWNLDGDFSLMHRASGTCRCGLEVQVYVDLTKLPAYTEIEKIIKQSV